jgi:putative flippase GtrA
MSDIVSIHSERRGIIRRISTRVSKSKSREIERFIKFVMVGALGFIIDLSVTNFFMIFVFHVTPDDKIPALLATSIGFTSAVTSNFFWNRYWTYPDSRSRSLRRQLAQFFVVNTVGLIIRALMLTVLYFPFNAVVDWIFNNLITFVQFTPSQMAKIATNMVVVVCTGVVMFWNFFVNRYWTYNDVD